MPRLFTFMKNVFIILSMLIPSLSFANDEIGVGENQQTSEGLWNYKRYLLDENGTWSVGVGTIVQNSPFAGEKTNITPIPMIDYSSKNIFIRGLRAGYHFKTVKSFPEGGFFLNGFLSPRMRPGDSRQKVTLDGGLSGGYQSIFGGLTLTAQQNLAGGAGTELSIGYGLRLGPRSQKYAFMPNINLIWQSKGLSNYMWGVDQETFEKTLANPDELTLNPYQLNSSVLNYQASMTFVYKVDDNWNLMTLGTLTALDDKITANPAVERQLDYGFIFGLSYTF